MCHGAGVCHGLRLVVAALGSKPRVVAGLDGVLGKPLDEEAMSRIADNAYKQCHPLTNIAVDPDWRHDMVPVYVRRALRAAASVLLCESTRVGLQSC